MLAAQNWRQEILLLLPIAELHQHRRYHLQAERQLRGRTGQGALEIEQVALDGAPSGATEFLGPGRGTPALSVENALPSTNVVGHPYLAIQGTVSDVLGKPGLEK